MDNKIEDQLIKQELENIGGERSIAWMKYRWEFLRRNPEYIQAYRDLPEDQKGEKQVAQKFGLSLGMIDPSLSFEDLLESARNIDLESDPLIHLRVLATHLGYQPPFFEGTTYKNNEPINFPEKHDFNRLLIGIDFDKVNSLSELKKSIDSMIDFHWQAYHKKNKRKTRSLVDYDLILMVGDLREKENLTNEQIAKRLFPRDFDPDNENAKPESKIKLAQRYYKTYKEIVEGGYKNFQGMSLHESYTQLRKHFFEK